MERKANENFRYLSNNESDKEWGVSITTVGYQHIFAHEKYPPQGHPQEYNYNPHKGRVLAEYQLVYVLSGRGSFLSKSKVELKAGSLFMLFPGVWHSYYPDKSTGWEVFWIGFNGSYPDSLLQKKFFNHEQAVHFVDVTDEIVELFKKSVDLAREEKFGYQQLLAGITIHLLGLVYYNSLHKINIDKDLTEKIEQARTLIRNDYSISPEEIANKLNMSYTWFRRIFKKYIGIPPAQYRNQIKLEHSKELLRYSSKSIKEIALQLNFETPYYFCVYFKRETKMTPNEYRRRFELSQI